MTEQQSTNAEPAQPAPDDDQPRPGSLPSATLGTGSALALGCIGVAFVLFLIALVLRWLTGIW